MEVVSIHFPTEKKFVFCRYYKKYSDGGGKFSFTKICDNLEKLFQIYHVVCNEENSRNKKINAMNNDDVDIYHVITNDGSTTSSSSSSSILCRQRQTKHYIK
ncbi:hypothetical protein DERF_006120 [Dermatophagoides farinae]|uniref:Uncharacterized protein n=1 Tax=Dermatophagoides farinae TaxID=6954 RepID=A0A922I5M0_DERFA|nr:hypothetical protein DERF_006120 [Dermatophagoides farinae]